MCKFKCYFISYEWQTGPQGKSGPRGPSGMYLFLTQKQVIYIVNKKDYHVKMR